MNTKVKEQPKSEFKVIHLREITANSGQTRMLGVMPQLKALGYGVFEKEAVDKDPIWPDLLSDNPKAVKNAIALIREHEPDIAAAAESQEAYSQLQPIRVQQLDDGTYDVLSGMTRCLARALKFAESKTNPDTIEAVVVDISKVKEVDKLFMAFADNNDRRQEGVIDKALFFNRMKKEHKLSNDDVGKRVGYTAQSIADYIKMIHPKLKDRMMDIQDGDLTIDKAKKLLAKRLSGEADEEDTNGKPPSGERARLPGVKKLEFAYSSKKRPDWMEQKVWEWFVSDTTRQFISFYLGKKFRPFNGEIQASEEKPKALKLSIPKKKAVRLMVALGREEAADWDSAVLKEKLENIPNQMESPDLKLDDEGLQTLLEKLVKHYSTGIEVFIKE